MKGDGMWARQGKHLSLLLWGFDPQHPCSVLGAANTAWAESGRVPSFPQLPSLLCVPKLGGHSPGVSWGLRAQPCRAQPGCPQSHKHTQGGFTDLFLISFIAPAPGKREVTAEGSSWQQPGGFGRTDVRGKITGAKSVGFDSAAAQRLSACQGSARMSPLTAGTGRGFRDPQLNNEMRLSLPSAFFSSGSSANLGISHINQHLSLYPSLAQGSSQWQRHP